MFMVYYYSIFATWRMICKRLKAKKLVVTIEYMNLFSFYRASAY